MTNDSPPTRSYRGNCHCGAFVFTLDIPEIQKLGACNCSYCHKRGILWNVVADPSQFSLVKGNEEDLGVYQFGEKNLHHKFCKTCGSKVFSRWPTAPEEMRLLVNARCLQDIDIWSIPITTSPGKDWGAPHTVPTYTGAEPPADIKNAQVYHGSCHCGSVQLAFKSEPLKEDTKIVECNCSVCQRNAYQWLYPLREQVSIQHTAPLTSYIHSTRAFVKTFCSECGTPIQNVARNLTEEELTELGPDVAEFNRLTRKIQPLNIRLLDDVDTDMFKNLERANGWDRKPEYVNP